MRFPAAAILLGFVLLLSSPAAAQQGYGFASFETAGDEVSLATAGATVFGDGAGWKPAAGLLAYHVQYPAGPAMARFQAVVGTLAVRYQQPAGAVQFGLGYGLTTGQAGAREGPRGGITTSAVVDLAPGSTLPAQAIASYNWTGDYAWLRLRAMHRADRYALGLEATAQGETSSPATTPYRVLQIAPVAEFAIGPHWRVAAAAGPKFTRPNSDRRHLFGRIELLWIP